MLRRLALGIVLLLAVGLPIAPPIARAGSGGQPQVTLIDQAARLLMQKFFEPIDSSALFAAAVAGANAELKRQGAGVALRQPQFTKDYATDWQSFSAAYNGAAQAYSSQIDQGDLAHATIQAMAESLNDCHTYFMSASVAQQMQQGLRGQGGAQGVGVVLRSGADGYPLVEDVYKNSPAATAGVQRGDRLLTVDNQDVRGLKPEQLGGKLREPLGQSVLMTFSRASLPVPIPLSVVRGSYQVPTYETRVMPGNVGYIHIFTFAETIDANTIQTMYREVAQQGATSVVIDLRNNPGGSGQAAIALLSSEISPNQLLFAHANRDGSTLPMYSISNAWPSKPPMAILINNRTASAGEIVAAVAQDYGIAKVIGEKSHGCLASVDFTPLSDGSALGITGARVVTAKNRSLNRIGVTPDIPIDYSVDDLMRGDDPQLAKAVDWVRFGR